MDLMALTLLCVQMSLYLLALNSSSEHTHTAESLNQIQTLDPYKRPHDLYEWVLVDNSQSQLSQI